ncbi:MAG: SAM-dependent chlorinase/fluorinase [Anaerolineae bacterium]|nr:SAM-dependent chlorinase/fluorinase [Anaerolineae bacterium]
MIPEQPFHCQSRKGGQVKQIITLCTDFGLRDGYVAAMKGVILSIAPQATLVDISHGIAAHNLLQGAYVLASACPFFPEGTVHLVVIDPGVGSGRRAVAVRTAQHTFVAPDNGVLNLALKGKEILQAVCLTAQAYWRTTQASSTFHGRDIFAPVAAHLARGVALEALGDPLDQLQALTPPQVVLDPQGGLIGHVVHIDHFGNLITDIPAARLLGRRDWQVEAGAACIQGLEETYARVSPGQLLALVGSHECLEIAVREGNAAERLKLNVGAEVHVR